MARKILLADDSVTAQNMGRKILADAGYEVITVNNGSAALKKIAEVKPDLIVLDVYMPGYSGLEVCQRLKEAGDTARIPVLLTVGKLEPFKPEEARRVRAEGFIVKPFEASELLSALTKLEDKMVPRSESSKPGRFARTIAAVEEGRYDKSANGGEDSGWKNRIAFPSKKKDKAAEKDDSSDPAIYNPVNKDLRTVVEAKPAPAAETKAAQTPIKTEEARVDLGALAPEGLPKDVTAEEIAALAAAAAQIQGKAVEAKADAQGADSKIGESSSESKLAEPKLAEAPIAGTRTEESKTSEAKVEEIRPPESTAAQPTAQQSPVSEALKIETAATEQMPAASPEPATVASFAERKPEETRPYQKPDQQEEKTHKAVAETSTASLPSAPLPTSADVTAAIASLETPGNANTPAANSDASDTSPDREQKSEPEPVTMAVAAAAAHSSAAPRWMAVSVALAPEETGIALEDEMRRYSAAYAARDGSSDRSASGASIAISCVTETQPSAVTAPAEIAPSTELSQPAQTVQQVSATMPASEPVPSAMAATAGAEGFFARVKTFESVSASSAMKPATPESAPAMEAAASKPEVYQPQPIESTAVQESASAASESPKYEELAAETKQEIQAQETLKEEPVSAVALPAVDLAAPATMAETNFAAHAEESVAAPVAAEELSTATTEPVSISEQSSESRHAAPNKESDIAATTAAAWASWRRVRESGDSNEPAADSRADVASSASSDEAAMAVAAGAEKSPEEGPEIASIVDSVLADLRPKIVEEISRKLRKK